MKICAECQDEHRRRTTCPGCKAKLCQFCYDMHSRARHEGMGCIVHMISVVAKRLKKKEPTEAEYREAIV